MKLPNGNRAIVDIRKLRDYCLNADNPKGKHKARVFARALGITEWHSNEFRLKLLEIAANEDAVTGELDIYGQRYTIDFEMETEIGKATVRSGWIVLHGEKLPRFTTCYVRKNQ